VSKLFAITAVPMDALAMVGFVAIGNDDIVICTPFLYLQTKIMKQKMIKIVTINK
jgi:hypothetical protein